ncbi:GntP family permease [Peribacillus asahii]|uniref:GntP family permease n=1 Tax=Peribacillus asahii TaxID=228899 RepID=UPI00207AE42F|nr:GntP family permease [Peribacillus asahii]USK59254.1 GntP family permease [Peribacillus asahii]
MFIEVIAILFSLGLLIFLAYRGFPVIVIAPIVTLLAVALSGMALLPSYTEVYMPNLANYIKTWFPIFILGAVFGKLMELNGGTASIAKKIMDIVGVKRALLATILACSILTYGGVSLFVVVFAVYPFAAAVFREANIPKRFIPAVIVLGGCTYTMDAFPGTPQIQNIIPTNYFGTDAYAAPITGLVAGTIIFSLGYLWLSRRIKKANLAGEGYGEGHKNEPVVNPDEKLINFWVAIIPLVVVVVLNFVFTKTRWSVSNWYTPELLQETFKVENLSSVTSTWALIVALVLGIIAALLINIKAFTGSKLSSGLTVAAGGSLLAVFNVASEVGFGNVVKTLPGFEVIRNGITGVSSHPLISESIAVNVLAGVVGSSSGGMSIALEVMGQHYLNLANSIGMNPEFLHRVASMSAGGLDSLPHSGATITILAICGLTHRQSYGDIFAITIMKAIVAFSTAVILSFIV